MPERQDRAKEEQFLRLITSHQGRIFAYIISCVPHRPDAEDLMQDTVTVLWRKCDQYQVDTSFYAWAIQVARYKILNFYKKKSRSPQVHFSEETLEFLHRHSEQMFENINPRLEALRRCVSKLPVSDSALMQLRYVQNMTVSAISSNLNKSVRGVYKHLAKVHELLVLCVRRTLREEGM